KPCSRCAKNGLPKGKPLWTPQRCAFPSAVKRTALRASVPKGLCLDRGCGSHRRLSLGTSFYGREVDKGMGRQGEGQKRGEFNT
ncbi:MAG: hypothetical protein AAFR63_19060, partial [Cyanobacteria bacterium J06631_6]